MGPPPWPSSKPIHGIMVFNPKVDPQDYAGGYREWPGWTINNDVAGFGFPNFRRGIWEFYGFQPANMGGKPIEPIGSRRSVETPLSRVYQECSEMQPAVTCNTNVLRGKPRIAGTRIPVSLVLRYLATDDNPVDDLGITKEDVADCLEFAALVCDYSLVSDD